MPVSAAEFARTMLYRSRAAPPMTAAEKAEAAKKKAAYDAKQKRKAAAARKKSNAALAAAALDFFLAAGYVPVIPTFTLTAAEKRQRTRENNQGYWNCHRCGRCHC